jgi:hypothetical protein
MDSRYLVMRSLALIFSVLIFPAFAAAEDRSVEGRSGEMMLAQLITGTPEEKLYKLLRPHFYYGGHVTPDIKAATGDPNIPVIDRRWRWGEVYSCNYIFLEGGRRRRALLCD